MRGGWIVASSKLSPLLIMTVSATAIRQRMCMLYGHENIYSKRLWHGVGFTPNERSHRPFMVGCGAPATDYGKKDKGLRVLAHRAAPSNRKGGFPGPKGSSAHSHRFQPLFCLFMPASARWGSIQFEHQSSSCWCIGFLEAMIAIEFHTSQSFKVCQGCFMLVVKLSLGEIAAARAHTDGT